MALSNNLDGFKQSALSTSIGGAKHFKIAFNKVSVEGSMNCIFFVLRFFVAEGKVQIAHNTSPMAGYEERSKGPQRFCYGIKILQRYYLRKQSERV